MRDPGLLVGALTLLQIGFLLGQGTALQLELAPCGLGLLDLHLGGFAACDVPELLGIKGSEGGGRISLPVKRRHASKREASCLR